MINHLCAAGGFLVYYITLPKLKDDSFIYRPLFMLQFLLFPLLLPVPEDL